MGKTAKALVSVLLVLSMFAALLPTGLFVSAETTEQAQDSIVVIDDSLKTEDSLSIFNQSFGCTPVLKEIDGEVVGITMGGVSSALGYPYMLFGETEWEDYILEFTSHDLVRVAGIVRSSGAVSGNDSYGGLAALYETTYLSAAYSAYESSKYSTKGLTTAAETGAATGAAFTYRGDMRFVIKVEGNRMTTTVSYTDADGNAQSHTTDVDTTASGKTYGKPGLRTVYHLVNGTNANGYFSDLKLTLIGDTATQYKKEQSTASHVVIDDSLKTEESLGIFKQSFGGTPALKVIDGETVGVTIDGATSALGYPYMLFGDAEWEDYILEFTSHDLVRVAGIVRASGAVSNNDGYGGLMAAYETTNLTTKYSSKSSTGSYSSVTLKRGAVSSASFTHAGDLRFVIKVLGNKMTTTVSYTDANGTPQSYTTCVLTEEGGKTQGMLGLRTVYNLVNGAKASGYFSDLKVTLLGETAEKYLKENPVERHVVIDDSLKTEQSLDIFTTVYGGTPALKEIDGEVVGVTIDGATSALGYPYMLFGESDWEDYILEFTTHDIWRVAGIVRSDGGAWGNDAYGGLLALYETTYLSNAYSSYNSETKAYSTVSIKDGDATGASFTYTGEMRFVIKVVDDLMITTVTYTDSDGNTVTHKLDVNTTASGKTAGKLGIRAVFNQVNGTVSSGYFSDLKVTLLGDTATKYLSENPEVKYVAVDSALTDAKDLDMFDAYGCTPALKIVDGEVVGITMGNATSNFGYPYMLFGDEGWEDYILEFTTHDMWRVGGIVRALGEIAHIDGYGGLLAAYETNSLTVKNSVYDSEAKNFVSATLKDGAHPSAAFTYDGEMRFVIKVVGDTMKVTVSFKNASGEPRSYSIDANIAETGRDAGRLGLRAVFNQVNGEKEEGYFSDLKVTLLGETAQNYIDSLPKFAGDLDGDGALSNADVAMLVRYLSGWKLDFGTSKWADIDGNETVNNRDAIMLIQMIAGWIDNGNLELDLSSSRCSTSLSNVLVSSNEVNTVEPLVFGDNISWRFDGFGLWDAEKNAPNPELLEALRASGITSLRYTGGIEGDYFHWYETIGSDRVEQICPWNSQSAGAIETDYPYFGIEEFFYVCEELGIPAVIQLNCGNGTPEEAADLIKWCEDNRKNVSSYCLGNEMHLGEEMVPGVKVTKTPEEYIEFYLEMYELLGDYADNIVIGCAALTSEHLLCSQPNWDAKVLSSLNGKIDFVDAHIAYTPYAVDLSDYTNEEIIRCYLASATYIGNCIDAQLENIDKYCPEASLQITEYGTLGLRSNSMVGAVTLASMLSIMTEEERLSSANHFSALLINEGDPTLVGHTYDDDGNLIVFDNAMSPIFRWYSEQSGRAVLNTRVTASAFNSEKCGIMPEITDAPTLYCNTYYDEATGEGSIIIVNTNPANNEQTDIKLPFGIQITDVAEVYSVNPLARNDSVSSPVTERQYIPKVSNIPSGEFTVMTKPISVVRIDFTVAE